MQTYIILLRGVMPTGKNKVPMASLRVVLTKAGLSDVQTYIQSGNVLARSMDSAAVVGQLVHDQIEHHFGGDLAVLVRTPSQVRDILLGNPFTDVDLAQLYFVVLSERPEESRVRDLAAQLFSPSRFVITNTAVYLYCPQGYSNSKINNNLIEKKLGVSATMRNYNTMTRLVALTGGVYEDSGS